MNRRAAKNASSRSSMRRRAAMIPPSTSWSQTNAKPGSRPSSPAMACESCRAATPANDDTARLRGAVSGIGRGALRPRDAWSHGLVPEAGGPHPDSGPLLCRRERASGSWRANGDDIGGSRRKLADGSRFDLAVPPGGYAWWYLDAVSDDGRNALTIIGFVGSVFFAVLCLCAAPQHIRAGGEPRLTECGALWREAWLGHDRARASALSRDRDWLVSARVPCVGRGLIS